MIVTSSRQAGEDAVAGATGGVEPRWPAALAFLMAWWMPATTARRMQHVSLARAYAVHFAAVVLGALLIGSVVAWQASGKSGQGFGFVGAGIVESARQLTRTPGRLASTIAGGLALTEFGAVLLAFMVAAWGARDEGLWASVANSLRWTWLQTTHLLPLVALIGILAVSIDHARDEWLARRAEIRLMESAAEGSAGAGTASVRAAALREWVRSRPWPEQNEVEIIGYACFIGATWFLWALLRGVGARRDPPPVPRPPLCEACGYILTGVTGESQCPECGEPLANSLGPDARPGTLWEQRREVGFRRAWWRCCVDPVMRPLWFGRQVRLTSSRRDCRWFLAMHLVPIFLLGAVGLMSGYPLITGYGWPFRLPYIFLAVGPLGGYLCALGMFFFALAAAGLVGAWFWLRDERNLMAGTLQVAAYLSGFLVVWTVVAVVTGLAIGPWQYLLGGLAKRLHADTQSVAFLCWLPANLAFALEYFSFLARATTGLRYANR
jgi:hypothetical protein